MRTTWSVHSFFVFFADPIMDFMKVFDQTVREMWAQLIVFQFESISISFPLYILMYNFHFCFVFWIRLQKKGGEFESIEGSWDRTEGNDKSFDICLNLYNKVWGLLVRLWYYEIILHVSGIIIKLMVEEGLGHMTLHILLDQIPLDVLILF